MSSGNTHLCYACRQAVRPYGQDMICPYCDGGFVQELNEIDGGVLSPFDFFGLETNEHHDHRFGIMDVLSALMRQRMRLRNGDVDVRGRPGMIAEHGMRFGPGPCLIFHGQLPVRVFENGGIEVLLNGAPAIGLRRANMGDYHFGADLDELIEQLTRKGNTFYIARGDWLSCGIEKKKNFFSLRPRARANHCGQCPRSYTTYGVERIFLLGLIGMAHHLLHTAIDAMPAVKINQRHLRGDSHCPVCMDIFELGSEAFISLRLHCSVVDPAQFLPCLSP